MQAINDISNDTIYVAKAFTCGINLLFQTTSRDSDSLIRYGGYASEYDYDPSQPCWKHPKIRENWKMVLAATALLIIGICKFIIMPLTDFLVILVVFRTKQRDTQPKYLI